jgi:hypothetical protein
MAPFTALQKRLSLGNKQREHRNVLHQTAIVSMDRPTPECCSHKDTLLVDLCMLLLLLRTNRAYELF